MQTVKVSLIYNSCVRISHYSLIGNELYPSMHFNQYVSTHQKAFNPLTGQSRYFGIAWLTGQSRYFGMVGYITTCPEIHVSNHRYEPEHY